MAAHALTHDRTRRMAEGVHLAFLGLWIGALVMIGIGAPLVFITLRSLEPGLPQFEAYDGPHYLIAGGQIVRRLFGVCDVIQSVSLIAVLGTLAVIARREGLRGLTLARSLIAFAVLILLGYRFFVLGPELTQQLLNYWEAAGAGDSARAAELRAVYEPGHRFEERLFAATALMVVAMLGLGFWSLGRTAKDRVSTAAPQS